MSWAASTLLRSIENSEVSAKIIKSTEAPNAFLVTTCYVRVVLVPKREDWEEFAENCINEDVFRRLDLSDTGCPDLPDAEDD